MRVPGRVGNWQVQFPPQRGRERHPFLPKGCEGTRGAAELQLRERDAARAIDRLSLIAAGWEGGTRIGASLAEFNRHHARRALNGHTMVIIVSDGYDTGDPAALGRELAEIRRRARRVVWLNPMLGWRDYAPVAAGMAAALPHVDLFAPAHNLASLAALEDALARL